MIHIQALEVVSAYQHGSLWPPKHHIDCSKSIRKDSLPRFKCADPDRKQSTFDSQLDFSQDLQYTTPNDDYWCDTCTLPYSDCLCYATSPISTHQSSCGYQTPNGKTYDYSQIPYPTTYSASGASSTSSYYTSSASSQPQSSYSAIAPAQTPSSGNGTYDSTPSETSSKRGKRKGSMPPAEAREVRTPTMHRYPTSHDIEAIRAKSKVSTFISRQTGKACGRSEAEGRHFDRREREIGQRTLNSERSIT